jgi:hypothetical protein
MLYGTEVISSPFGSPPSSLSCSLQIDALDGLKMPMNGLCVGLVRVRGKVVLLETLWLSTCRY